VSLERRLHSASLQHAHVHKLAANTTSPSARHMEMLGRSTSAIKHHAHTYGDDKTSSSPLQRLQTPLGAKIKQQGSSSSSGTQDHSPPQRSTQSAHYSYAQDKSSNTPSTHHADSRLSTQHTQQRRALDSSQGTPSHVGRRQTAQGGADQNIIVNPGEGAHTDLRCTPSTRRPEYPLTKSRDLCSGGETFDHPKSLRNPSQEMRGEHRDRQVLQSSAEGHSNLIITDEEDAGRCVSCVWSRVPVCDRLRMHDIVCGVCEHHM
jgi:hypothetical protein